MVARDLQLWIWSISASCAARPALSGAWNRLRRAMSPLFRTGPARSWVSRRRWVGQLPGRLVRYRCRAQDQPMVGDPQQILGLCDHPLCPRAPHACRCTATAARSSASRSLQAQVLIGQFLLLLFECGTRLIHRGALLGQDVTLVTERILLCTQCCGGLGERLLELFLLAACRLHTCIHGGHIGGQIRPVTKTEHRGGTDTEQRNE